MTDSDIKYIFKVFLRMVTDHPFISSPYQQDINQVKEILNKSEEE